ncbi:uncharacterized protein MYCFIDRAFT_209293 [Pseudocercospora fijiensis CIRAD86]|uniref:Uncharacterized protein n=1 Tax=Pseudocercospora fijiensis (strain CIRAD86) TaxID=383855 RepID=M3AJ88_PSEFD|nr:uncharacterized protein MYCFIDRAFT_209293 [Pseudocercospora fijiensis CIRAD86]EME77238.1 hypothetical protein MYCFIDRAFT_209293 [Pseudocercospora fijiensis CIRAD86]
MMTNIPGMAVRYHPFFHQQHLIPLAHRIMMTAPTRMEDETRQRQKQKLRPFYPLSGTRQGQSQGRNFADARGAEWGKQTFFTDATPCEGPHRTKSMMKSMIERIHKPSKKRRWNVIQYSPMCLNREIFSAPQTPGWNPPVQHAIPLCSQHSSSHS